MGDRSVWYVKYGLRWLIILLCLAVWLIAVYLVFF